MGNAVAEPRETFGHICRGNVCAVFANIIKTDPMPENLSQLSSQQKSRSWLFYAIVTFAGTLLLISTVYLTFTLYRGLSAGTHAPIRREGIVGARLLRGRTEVRYGLMPHAGEWDEAGIPATSMHWQEPALGALSPGAEPSMRSFIDPGESGWAVPVMFERNGMLSARSSQCKMKESNYG